MKGYYLWLSQIHTDTGKNTRKPENNVVTYDTLLLLCTCYDILSSPGYNSFFQFLFLIKLHIITETITSVPSTKQESFPPPILSCQIFIQHHVTLLTFPKDHGNPSYGKHMLALHNIAQLKCRSCKSAFGKKPKNLSILYQQ